MKPRWKTLPTLSSLSVASAIYANRPPTDEAIARLANRIRREIASLPNYGVFDNISFRIQDAEVVLMGRATRRRLRSAAEEAVRKLQGVGRVVNRIELLSNSNQDERIRAAVYARIYGDKSMSPCGRHRRSDDHGEDWPLRFGSRNDPPSGPHTIHIIVENGGVKLEGVVNSEANKNIAGIQANQVKGTCSVENNLVVLRNGRTETNDGDYV